MSETGLLLVQTNSVTGREDEFNRWYTETHLPEVLAVPGVVRAQRYAVVPVRVLEFEGMSVPPPAHRHLAIYELDARADDVMAEFLRRLGSGEMTLSDTMDPATIEMSIWTPNGAAQVIG
ncbi:hypothetical protein OG874_11675 [Nocardia sp. NBC_00565]|uniref:hypothetical protein n=1 Tax=Nocardia sp. NBC_00565 TaxID=2975993 RepID=UPI002E803082|nr:hypothetical protein [Nocardia sp. NBC_00565]WUC05750.1 hypothetical protein OG874_11675 [Nocardia sp. NBC_00565]